jgi:hypothetical protein
MALRMEAVRTSETSVHCNETIRRCIPENSKLERMSLKFPKAGAFFGKTMYILTGSELLAASLNKAKINKYTYRELIAKLYKVIQFDGSFAFVVIEFNYILCRHEFGRI